MLRRSAVLAAVAAAVAAALAAPAPALAADREPTVRTTTATGHDVSYPQCGRTLPQRGDIAVVGVNAGLGTTTNPCLDEQLAWGDAPAADGTARRADVYVNTANPGHLGGWWPRSDLTRTGLPVANPAGRCVGAEDEACAYVYGWSIAVDDALRRGVSSPGERTWWLDVETMNTWSWNRAANLAVLEGMTDALRSVGADVGVYSTDRQWQLIVGSPSPSSSLAGAPSWVAGAITRGGAEEHCRAAAFVPGGRVAMAQWVEDAQDHDVSCLPGVSGSTPAVAGDPSVGGLLVAVPGTWGPRGVRLGYRWLRDGAPIPGAIDSAYAPVAADAGRALALQVTGSRPGAPALTLTAGAVRIAPGAPTPSAGSTTPPPSSPYAPTASSPQSSTGSADTAAEAAD